MSPDEFNLKAIMDNMISDLEKGTKSIERFLDRQSDFQSKLGKWPFGSAMFKRTETVLKKLKDIRNKSRGLSSL